MTKHRCLMLICIVVLVTCQGCDTYQFGEQAKGFVDSEAYAYSKKLAEADLKARWPNFFLTALADTALSLDRVSRNLVDVSSLAKQTSQLDERAAVVRLIFYDRSIPLIRQNQDDIERALARIKLLDTVCEDRSTFDSLNMDLLALVGPLESLKIPELNWNIYIGSSMSTDSQGGNTNNQDSGSGNAYFWATVADSVLSLFNASIYEHQLDLFHEAVAEYPHKVVQDRELFSMSSRTCQESRKIIVNNARTAEQDLNDYKALNSKIEVALGLMHATDEAYLSPRRIESSMKDHGIVGVFENWRKQVLAGRISRDLAIAMIEIAQLQSSVADSDDCLQALSLFDELNDAIAENKAVLKTLEPSSPDEEVRARITNRLAKLDSITASQNKNIIPRLKSVCANTGTQNRRLTHEAVLSMPKLQDVRFAYEVGPSNSPPTFDFVLKGPKYARGYNPQALCQVLQRTGSSAICQSSPPRATNVDRLCVYGDFCVEAFPSLAFDSRRQHASFVDVVQRSVDLRGLTIGLAVVPELAGTPEYHILYRGPDTGRPSNAKTALGVAGYVLGNILRDGGFGGDARRAVDELNGFKSNINQRVQYLSAANAQVAKLLQAFVPEFSSTMAEHSAFINRESFALDAVIPGLEASPREITQEVASEPIGNSGVSEKSIIAGLSLESTVESAKESIALSRVRPSGSSIAGITEQVRAKSFSSSDVFRREIQREARRAKAVFANPSLAHPAYEIDAARAYAISKLEIAFTLIQAGRTSSAQRYLEDARSARYFAEGMLGGVVNLVTLDGNREQISFTDSPRIMAGSIWAAVLTSDELDRDAELRDFGLPYLSLTFHDVPEALAVRTYPVSAPHLPHGESVDENIRKTIVYLRWEALFKQDPGILTGDTLPVSKLLWFRDQVRPHKAWDYKRIDQKYDYAGNFNYGATGGALGLSLDVLLRAAGMEKVRSRGPNPKNGSPWGAWPYGNEPDKQRAIEEGFTYYMQHREYWDRLRFAGLREYQK